MSIIYLCCNCAKVAAMQETVTHAQVIITLIICITILLIAVIATRTIIKLRKNNAENKKSSNEWNKQQEVQDAERKLKANFTEKLLDYLKEQEKNKTEGKAHSESKDNEYVRILKLLIGIPTENQKQTGNTNP